MFGVNVNPNETVILEADYIMNNQNIVTPSYPVGSNSRFYWIDATNKYLYLVYSQAAAPWIRIMRYSYDTPGQLTNETQINLSGFGTLSAQPTFNTIQGSIDGNFFIYWTTVAGAGVPTNLSAYPVTISGTTATLGTMNTTPVVASYTISRLFAVGTTLYAFYSLTASTYNCDVGRKWNGGSWTTLTGSALPSILGTILDSAGGRAIYSKYFTSFGGGANHDKFYTPFISSGISTYFDANNETRNIATMTIGTPQVDVNGFIWATNGLFNNSIQTVSKGGANPPIPTDITNGFVPNTYGNDVETVGAFIGTNKYIRKLVGEGTTSGVNYLLYSTDGGTNRQSIPYVSTLQSDYNINIFGANLIAMAIYIGQSTIKLTAEIVS